MTHVRRLLLPLALLAAPAVASADDWGDERRGRDERAQVSVHWEGDCRVEQRLNRDGELVERRRCNTERDDDGALRRFPRERAEARYRDERADEPRRNASYREQPRYGSGQSSEPDRLPVYRDDSTVPMTGARTQPVAPQVTPVLPVPLVPLIRTVPAPAARAPRVVAQAAPVVAVKAAVVKPVVVARAPTPVRVAVKQALPPAPAHKLMAKVEPRQRAQHVQAKQPVVKVAAITHPARLLAKATVKTPHVLAKPVMVAAVVHAAPHAPIVKAKHLAALTARPAIKVEVLAKPRAVAARSVPVAPAATIHAMQVASKAVSKPAARVVIADVPAPKPQPVVKSAPEPVREAPFAKPHVVAKVDEAWQARAIDEYVNRKSHEPYSNLK